MKRYDNIMQDNVQAPKTENNIWLKNNMLYYYVNGKWQLIGGSSEEDKDLLYNLKQEVEDLIGLSTSDAIDNLNEIKKFLEGFKDDEELKEWMNNYYTKDEIDDIVKENTSDWDAAEGEKGFIKNRPFYSEVEPLFDTSWERADYDSYFQGAYQVHLTLGKDITFEVGKTYDVYFDDKKFTGKCRHYETLRDPEIGGGKIDYYSISDQPDDAEIKNHQYPLINGATFSLHISAGTLLSGNKIEVYYRKQVLNSAQGSLRVLENNVLKKIDEKYLPDSVTNALVQVKENTNKLKGVEDNLQEKLDKIPTLQDGVKGAEKNYIYSDPTKAGKGAIAAARYRANDKGKLTAQYKYWGDSDFNYNTEFPQATPTTDGVMSAEDKKALDKINNDFDTLEFTVGTLNEGLGHANNDITKLGERITTLDDELANAVIGEEVIDEDVFPDIDKYTKEELAEELASVSPTIQDIKHNYARKDGAYEGMLVGTALNLQGQDESVNSSMYRTAGGTADIASGLAEVVGIRGESVAWNQLVQPFSFNKTNSGLGITAKGDGYNITFSSDNIISNSGGVLIDTKSASLIVNHKYLFHSKPSKSNALISLFIQTKDSEDNVLNAINLNRNNSIIVSITKEVQQNLYFLYNNAAESKGQAENVTYKDIQIFDLTLIYGAGNEPSTAEQFEADYQRWFGKPLTYEEYDEGSIRNVKAEGIKTVGFNLSNITEWKGKVRDFYYGSNNEYYPKVRSLWANDCGYKGQIEVSFNSHISLETRESLVIEYTDGAQSSVPANVGLNIGVSTIGKIVKRVRPSYNVNSDLDYTNICIHFVWSGKRDGEYEPHWEETKSLPITSLKGKLNGEGQEVVIFPDGMKKAGNIYDEIKVEGGVVKAIRRVGSVDLGTLGWSYADTFTCFRAAAPGQKLHNLVQVVCPNFVYNPKYQNRKDKEIFPIYGPQIGIMDTSFGDDETAFKQSVNGIVTFYDLEEPEEYILSEDTLPLVYKVDDFGTEQVISPENTIAPSLIVKYGMNAVDTLRRLPQNYISVESMDNFLSRLSAAMNGTWTKVWNESTGRYDFSFVANIQNDVE